MTQEICKHCGKTEYLDRTNVCMCNEFEPTNHIQVAKTETGSREGTIPDSCKPSHHSPQQKEQGLKRVRKHMPSAPEDTQEICKNCGKPDYNHLTKEGQRSSFGSYCYIDKSCSFEPQDSDSPQVKNEPRSSCTSNLGKQCEVNKANSSESATEDTQLKTLRDIMNNFPRELMEQGKIYRIDMADILKQEAIKDIKAGRRGVFLGKTIEDYIRWKNNLTEEDLK